MKRNPVEAILGFLVLIFAVLFLFFASSRVDVQKIAGYPVFARFQKVGGLEMGADVRINGIKVGSVTKIELNPETFMALVEMNIKEDIKLPADTAAVVADAGLMGDKYIRLEPGKSVEKIARNGYLQKTKDYKSLEDSVGEFIFLSTKDDKQAP